MDWNACTMEPNATLRWLECHPGLGGHLGAVMTVSVAAVALWVSVMTLRREGKHRKALALALAYRLMPSTIFLLADVQRIIAYLDSDEFQLGIMVGVEAADADRLGHGALPAGAMDRIDVLPFGIAADVGQLEQFLANFDRVVKSGLGPPIRSDVKARLAWETSLRENLRAIEHCASRIKDPGR
jgi:hypothetical protein